MKQQHRYIGKIADLYRRVASQRSNYPGFSGDTRAAAFNIGYLITTGIAALLVITLTVGTGSVLEAETSKAGADELSEVATAASSVIEETDRVGKVGDSSNVTLTQTLHQPEFASMHRVRLHTVGGDPHLTVTTEEADSGQVGTTVTVDLRVTATIEPTVVNAADELRVVHITRADGTRVILIESGDGDRVSAGGSP